MAFAIELGNYLKTYQDPAARAFDPQDEHYLARFTELKRFSSSYLDAYHHSLNYYKMFYNDVHEYGNPKDCTEMIYFVPGFNGTPGQIIFGLPGIMRHLGSQIYVKCLYVPHMSCANPTWIKYGPEAMEAKREQMLQDLTQMVESGKKVRIVVSSSGFYDFLGAYPRLAHLAPHLTLNWVSCAPDHVSPNRWLKFFYPLNGFEFDGCKWFSYPNVQLLKKLNPECGVYTDFKDGLQHNRYYKNELESRFYLGGLMWDYISIDFFNRVLQENLELFNAYGVKVEIPTKVLAGIKDGFWDDSSPHIIQQTLDRYLTHTQVLYKEESHLWVVTPNHIYDLLKA